MFHWPQSTRTTRISTTFKISDQDQEPDKTMSTTVSHRSQDRFLDLVCSQDKSQDLSCLSSNHSQLMTQSQTQKATDDQGSRRHLANHTVSLSLPLRAQWRSTAPTKPAPTEGYMLRLRGEPQVNAIDEDGWTKVHRKQFHKKPYIKSLIKGHLPR